MKIKRIKRLIESLNESERRHLNRVLNEEKTYRIEYIVYGRYGDEDVEEEEYTGSSLEDVLLQYTEFNAEFNDLDFEQGGDIKKFFKENYAENTRIKVFLKDEKIFDSWSKKEGDEWDEEN